MKTENKKSGTTFAPIFVGLLIIKGLSYAYNNNTLGIVDNWTTLLIIGIVIRLLIGFWTISLTNKYRLEQTLWVFLGFIFGSLQLIALNIAIWIKGKK